MPNSNSNLRKSDTEWKRFQSAAHNRKFSNRKAASRSRDSLARPITSRAS